MRTTTHKTTSHIIHRNNDTIQKTASLFYLFLGILIAITLTVSQNHAFADGLVFAQNNPTPIPSSAKVKSQKPKIITSEEHVADREAAIRRTLELIKSGKDVTVDMEGASGVNLQASHEER